MLKNVKVNSLKPASYNPRAIAPDALDNLKASIQSLGIIKPIIVRAEDGLILAGHQRTKAMQSLGIEECPAFVVSKVNSSDEVRFNQLHNMTEAEITDRAPKIKVDVTGKSGFVLFQPNEIQIISRGGEGEKVSILSRMMMKFGEFASCIANPSGDIIVSSIYALASKLTNIPLLVYVLPNGKEEDCISYFSKEYGEFCYDSIRRNTYMQTLAQKNRYRTDEKGKVKKGTHSTLYETQVIPYITKEMRILDFGAGHKDYAMLLRSKGYNIDAIEFYLRKRNVDAIDVQQIKQDFAEIVNNLKNNGLYDVVVCDSVLNSVDTLEAEKSVLMSISALCKKGGVIFWSGIPMDAKTYHCKTSRDWEATSKVKFIDKDGFTGITRFGKWFFQKYHTNKDIDRINRAYIGNKYKLVSKGASFQVKTINERVARKNELLNAIRFEFSLPLPNGKNWDFANTIIPILDELITE